MGGGGVTNEQTVLIEYMGPNVAGFIVRGPVTGQKYKFGLQPSVKQKYVYIEDAKILLKQKLANNVSEYVRVETAKPVEQNVLDFLAAP